MSLISFENSMLNTEFLPLGIVSETADAILVFTDRLCFFLFFVNTPSRKIRNTNVT